MAYNYASFYGDNYGSPDTGHQYGPYNLGSCVTLIRVSCAIMVTPIFTGTWANNFAQDFGAIWGMQWVPHGDSPLSLPGQIFEQNFLWVANLPRKVISNFSWAPGTDAGGISTTSTDWNEWRGQMPINQNIDLYVTTGSISGGGTEIQGAFMMKVVNST